MPRWAGEAELVPLQLLRQALPGVTVRASIPDGLTRFLPLIVVRRVTGSSGAPRWTDRISINVQCWSDTNGDRDPVAAASDLADQARRVLWEAWDDQKVTDAGHIVSLTESQGPMEVTDPDLPRLGRYVATYQMRIHVPQPA